MILTLVQRIKELSEIQPEKIAVSFKNERLSYCELNSKTVSIASRMHEFGITKGDRVMFSAVSKPEMVVMYLAIQYLGAIPVFVDKNATSLTAFTIYKDSGAKLFLTDKSIKEYEEELTAYSLRGVYAESGKKKISYVEPKDEDLAELIYTSGTTGTPKGCMLTYRAVNSILMNTVLGTKITNDSVTLIPLPLNHSFALRVLRANLYMGATVVLQNGFTFAKEIENNLDRFNCTSMAIVPASVETIEKQMQDKFSEVVGRLKKIEVSAGSLSVEQRKTLVKRLPDTSIINTWGSSETGGAIFLDVSDVVKNHPDKIGALGKPIDGVEVRTIDEEGNIFNSDKFRPGRMCIRGDMQMSGYWNKPELTRSTIRDGWLVTGDMIYKDDDGYIYMLGRADDMINVGGEKVSPVEIENVAGEYEYISECACIGVEDPEKVLGYVPVLFVVTKSSLYSEMALRKLLSQKLERFKIPVSVIEVLELPRNAMLKIDRNALKEMWNRKDSEVLFNETIHSIFTRRSVRKFLGKKIEKEILQTIVKAGYYAPTGHNLQTWKFTVITNDKELEILKQTARKTAKDNDIYFYGWNNPAAIIIVSNDIRNTYGCQDASCASENIMLAAWSYGIGSVWLNPLMTMRDICPMKELLDRYGIPDNHTVWSAIALGYPVADGVLLRRNQDVISWVE